MKRFFGFLLAVLIFFQAFPVSGDVVGEVEYEASQMMDFSNLTVHYGECSGVMYDEALGGFVIKCIPSEAETESDSGMVIDFNFKGNPVDLSTYRYMAIKYLRTGDGSAIRLRSFYGDGTNSQLMKYGKSGEWHTVVVDFGKKSATNLKQVHFTPYPDVETREFIKMSEAYPVLYIKSLGFYSSDPRTAEQKEEDNRIAQNEENIKGAVQENGVFERIEKLDKTDELLANTSIESLKDWSGTYSVPVLSQGGCDGGSCAKITERKVYYSGLKQDITNVLKTYGAGYYKISAYLKTDENSPIIGNLYDVRIGLTKLDETNGSKKTAFYYSSYPISDDWRKNENTVYIPWDEDCIAASFAVYGGTADETVYSDFYVDKCSMIKYIENEISEVHSAYIGGYSDGKFYPDKYITGSELAEAFKACTDAPYDYTVLQGSDTVTGTELTDIAKSIFGYSGSVDYSGINAVTRAEAVHFLNAVLKRKAAKVSYSAAEHAQFSDVSEKHWAYEDIVEAATDHKAHVYLYGDIVFSEAWEITADNYDREKAKERIAETEVQAELRRERIINARDSFTVSGTKYYVSNNGSDDNTGLSPNDAVCSISKISSFDLKPGDAVLFERGDIWRSVSFSAVSGVTYGAYGSGEKPKLCGSAKDYADSALWTKTDVKNVWQTTDKIIGSVGFIAFNDGEIFAQKVKSAQDLTEDLTFYDGTSGNDTVKLYCSKGNPGEVYENIEIAPGTSIIKAMNKENCTFDNLCLLYTGWHGMRFSSSNNIKVTNCIIGYIGGTGEGSRWGNGIEFWNSCENGVIKDNYLFQIYDTALTNQYSGVAQNPVVQSNITYSGNLIEYSTYAFEFFTKQENSNLDIMKNITVCDNIVRYTGCGWGESNRPVKGTSADIKGWNAKNRAENFVIKNNVFFSSKYRNLDWSAFAYNTELSKIVMNNRTPQYMPLLSGNTFITAFGADFGTFDYSDYTMDYTVNRLFTKYEIDTDAEIVFDFSSDESEQQPSEYSVPKPILILENNSVKAGNKIVSKLNLPKNNSGEDKKINFVLCFYNGIKLVAMKSAEYTHLNGAASEVLTNTIEIPEGKYKKYEIRAFVFNDNLECYVQGACIKY